MHRPSRPSSSMTPAQRSFLRLVADAAFSNPFSVERDELDYRIAGLTARVANDELMQQVRQRVGSALEELRAGDSSPLLARWPDERSLRTAVLFDVFHRYAALFDELIEKQYAAGEADVAVPFADELIATLESSGLTPAETDLYVAIFYQLRRAYFFIGGNLTGSAPCMVALRRHLWNNVFTFHPAWYEQHLAFRMEDFSTLLLGETGTGKGAVAAAIGRSHFIPYERSRKRFKESFTRAFVATNLSQFPGELIESALFGHKKGAFTGAIDNHVGLLGRSSPYGAVFLDEVGDVTPAVQVKLLGVLQERVFSPVGSYEQLRFSGRVIAATNKDVHELRRIGTFRDDFYYRLCSDVITVPPLRQRLAENPDELSPLLSHVLQTLAGADAVALLPAMREHVERSLPRGYDWPGNVRELEQCVRRILLTGHYDGDGKTRGETAQRGAQSLRRTAREVLIEHCRQLYQELGTYEEVARVAGLDRRTAKKYVLGGGGDDDDERR